MFKIAQKTARTFIVLSALFFSGFFLSVGYFIFGFHHTVPTPSKLAFWVEHDFSNGTESLSSLEDGPLSTLEGVDVVDLFVHTGPLNSDGTLPGDLSVANSFDTLSSGTVYAWLGQIRSKIDLDSPSVRANIIASAGTLLEAGFEGIHLDIEPIARDDQAFVELLKELRQAYPDLNLSVAMDEWQPHGLSQWIAKHYNIAVESYWSTTQVQSVLPYINQLVVMTYDTGFNDARLYEWWVEQQTIALTNILEGTAVELLVGIPSYEEGSAINPDVENLTTGLAGFLRGFSNLRSVNSVLGGVAVYPYWEMSTEEWGVLQNFFQSKP